MRPLFHPSISDVTVEGILHALSDPLRMTIYADIVRSDCPKACSGFRTFGERTVAKSSLSQHLKVLREAGLIRGERRGVEVHHTSRCAELELRFPGLIEAIIRSHWKQSKPKRRAAKSN